MADDIVVGRRSQGVKTASPCSPIGTDSSGAMFILSPPQHILGLFSPSNKSSEFIRSLTLSPSGNARSPVSEQDAVSSPRPTDAEEPLDFSLPPVSAQAISEHEEFLMGMGGMDDLETDELHHSPSVGRAGLGGYASPRAASSSLPLPIGTPLSVSPGAHAAASPRTHAASPRSPFLGPDLSVLSPRTLAAGSSPASAPLSPASPQPTSPVASGEHPYGEHPSRTLFVRNINSSIDDEELHTMFERFGPIRSMYTQCKHRGFVMISYYDIRDSKAALKSLQNTVLRRRKLDIHFSIPKDNPSEKDQNQGTLVVFNLDPSITNEDLRTIFGAYGEIKEIRETPNKKHHKFIEYYDVRHAEQAMRSLNKTEIRSKKIKIEHSRPGGLRKSVASHSSAPTLNGAAAHQPAHGGVEDFAAFAYQSSHATYVPGGSGRIESPPFTNSWLTPGAPSPRRATVTNSCPPGYGQHLAQSYPPKEATAFTRPAPQYPGFTPSVYGQRPMYADPMASMPGGHMSVMGTAWSMQSLELSASVPMMMPAQVAPVQRHAGQPRSLPGDSQESFRMQQKSGKGRQGRHSRSNNEQFVLSLENVLRGVDLRTTLMIKNIPNKYTQKMLLSTINQNHQGHYDFFYLPIDFKNKCNVGYAFINFVNCSHIPSFYEQLHNTKWSKFNSEKVCKITYARIQGKEALVDHFRNSTLLSEDKKCRPIIFHSEGPQAGQQAAFPLPSGGRREHRRDEKQSHKRK